MAQAKTLTPAELQQTLDYISTHSFAMRNRVMLLTGMWSGMRVGEIASLSVGDVMNLGGSIKAEVRLTAEQTKGRHPRTVFLPQKLRDELHTYMALRNPTDLKHPLFVSAGGRAFTANVLTQHFFWLFKRAGIAGATSHSMRRSFITKLGIERNWRARAGKLGGPPRNRGYDAVHRRERRHEAKCGRAAVKP